jgi:hypothetical protein
MIPRQEPCSIAVLDDYQNIALSLVDWSVLDGRVSVTVFNDHLAAADAVVERLQPFDIVCVMRERTPLTRAIIERLPRLRLHRLHGIPQRLDRRQSGGRTWHSGRSHRLHLGADHRTDLGPHPRQRPQLSRREHLAAQRRLAAAHRG